MFTLAFFPETEQYSCVRESTIVGQNRKGCTVRVKYPDGLYEARVRFLVTNTNWIKTLKVLHVGTKKQCEQILQERSVTADGKLNAKRMSDSSNTMEKKSGLKLDLGSSVDFNIDEDDDSSIGSGLRYLFSFKCTV